MEQELPYRRNLGRILAGATVLCIGLFLILNQLDIEVAARLVAFAGSSLAALWCPVLLYAGLRTANALDTAIGGLGTLTLAFWIPLMIYF